jgi:uncharacterized damage-inducible protein DinB
VAADRIAGRPLAHHLETQACNNAWANLRLLDACAALRPGEFEAPRTGFFPSLRATLNHNLTVDWLYVDALERSVRGEAPHPTPGQFFEPEQPCADVGALAAAQRAVDLRLIGLCRGLADADLGGVVRIRRAQGEQRDSRQRILAHLFQHQIHHRGQAHAMLSATSVAPPQLDEFYCAGEAPLRVAELARLGLDEAAIWGADEGR